MSMCRVVFRIVGRGYCYDQCILLAKLLPFSLLHSVLLRWNWPVIPGISWLPTFAFQSSPMKKTCFFGVLEGLVHHHKTIQLQLLQNYWLGHRLRLLWYWMFCLGNEQNRSVVFAIASKYCILDSFVDCDGYSISTKGILPTVVEKDHLN